MRKVVMLNRVSIEGFFAGPHGDFFHFHRFCGAFVFLWCTILSVRSS